MVTVETTSSRSIGIEALPLNTQPSVLHYMCNLTAEDSDAVQTLLLNDTRDRAPHSTVKSLSPHTNYTATCWVLKDGVDQCFIGSDTTLTYTDSELLLFFYVQVEHSMYLTGWLSPCSTHILFIQLGPTAPPQGVDIHSTSSHSFTMTWAPPPKGQQNGEIVSYAVKYREEGSNSTVVDTTRGLRYTAEDLTTDRVYIFKVAATTVNGTGPFNCTDVGTIPIGKKTMILDVLCVHVLWAGV